LDPLQLMRANCGRAYPVAQACASRTLVGSLDHAGRPIDREDAVAALRHAHGIESRAATEVEQVALPRKACIEPAPHFPAHMPDQGIVASGSVVVGGDAVEGGARIVQGIHHDRHFNMRARAPREPVAEPPCEWVVRRPTVVCAAPAIVGATVAPPTRVPFAPGPPSAYAARGWERPVSRHIAALGQVSVPK